jgi:hypothetical protein
MVFIFYSDEDMQSMASLMSTNNTVDIAIMKDFDEEEEDEGRNNVITFIPLVSNVKNFQS